MMKESTLKTITESLSSLKSSTISNINSTTGNSTVRASGIFSRGDGNNLGDDGVRSSPPNNFSTIETAKTTLASSSSPPSQHQTTRITYSNKKLYGRQKELQQLLQRYEQICVERMRRLKIIQQEQQREQQQRREEIKGNGTMTPVVDKAATNKPSSIKQSPPSSSSPTDHDIEPAIKTLFVSGYSGTGKTALIEEFVRMISKQQQQQQQSQHKTSKPEDHDNNGDGNHDGDDDEDEESSITNTGNSNSAATLLPCFFLQGKFEQQQNTAPYIALIQAMESYCQSILQLEDGNWEENTMNDERNEAVREIKRHVGSGSDTLGVLCSWIPTLSTVLSSNNNKKDDDSKQKQQQSVQWPSSLTTSDPSSSATAGGGGSDCEFFRIRFLLTKFCKAICKTRPIILFLDDLQWIDSASLDVLMDIIVNGPESSFLLIGAHRSNEVVDDDHILSSRLLQNENIPKTNINIPNLSRTDITEFVQDSLNLQGPTTTTDIEPLVEFLHEKTGGNIFFVRQSLDELLRHNVLYKSIEETNNTWRWNLELLKEKKNIITFSDNVVDAVQGKLSSLSPTLQKAFYYAALNGRSPFDSNTIEDFMKQQGDMNEDAQLVGLFDFAVYDGLLENSVGSISFRFAHDRIKDASLLLFSDHKNHDEERILERMGKYLLDRACSPNGEEWMPFTAADHLNSIPTSQLSLVEPLQVVELDLEVSQKSMKVAAFLVARKYLRRATEIIEEEGGNTASESLWWKQHYDLTLQVYVAAAEVEMYFGIYEKGSTFADLVIAKSNSKVQKLKVNLARASTLAKLECHNDARLILQKELYEMKGLPKRFRAIRVIKALRTVKKYFRDHSNYEILLLPRDTDPLNLLKLRYLGALTVRAFYCNKPLLVLQTTLLSLQHGFQHGHSPQFLDALSSYGLFLSGPLGDMESAIRMARLARELMEIMAKFGSKECIGHAEFVIGVYIDAWATPLPKVFETFQDSHRLGMEVGDVEHGFASWTTGGTHGFCAGFPLGPIQRGAQKLQEMLRQYDMKSIKSLHDHFMYTVEMLIGKGNGHTEIDFSELEDMKTPPANPSDSFRHIWWFWSRLQLSYYFKHYEIGDQMMDPYRKIAAIDTCYITVSPRVFFSGLTAFAMARRTGKNRKHLQKAKRFTAEMNDIMRNRGLNNLHKYLLLNAEQKSFEEKAAAKAAYDGSNCRCWESWVPAGRCFRQRACRVPFPPTERPGLGDFLHDKSIPALY